MSVIDKVFDRTTGGLENALDLHWKRNSAIASNVANVETPGYRAVDLDFTSELKRAFGQSATQVKKTDARHMDIGSDGTSRYVPDLSGATRADGNNVDLDIQMGKLTIAADKFAGAANLLRKKMRMISAAIRFGQR